MPHTPPTYSASASAFALFSTLQLVLADYMALPQPRTRQFAAARRMVSEQHSLPENHITAIDFHAVF
jgi:hypothetical protein